MSALDELNEVTETGKKSDVERPVVDCPANVHKPFYRFISAKAIFDIVESRVEVEKIAVCEVMLDAYMHTLFNTGSKPQNPAIHLEKDGRPDCKGIFQVKQQYKFNVEEGTTSIKDRLIKALTVAGYTRKVVVDVAKGLVKEAAVVLVESEIDTTPVTALRPFNELSHGHYVEKQFVEATAEEKLVAEKLIGFVMGRDVTPLTERERKLVVVKQDKVKVKDGFLDRIKLYCHTIEELKAVFAIIKPQNLISHTKFAISDTPATKNIRMMKEFVMMVKSKKK